MYHTGSKCVPCSNTNFAANNYDSCVFFSCYVYFSEVPVIPDQYTSFFLVVSRSGQQLINNKSRATGVKCATRSNTNNNELIIMNFCFMYRYQPRCVFSHFLFCLRVSSIFFLIISINLINSKKCKILFLGISP